MSILIRFGKIADLENKRQFLKEKLAAYFGDETAAEQNVDIVYHNESTYEMQLMPEEKFPILTDEIQGKIRNAKACMLKEVNNKFVLSQGEEIIEDFFSYTISETPIIPAGSPVLRRKTNFGTFYFISKESFIKEGNLLSRNEYLTSRSVIALAITKMLLKEVAMGLAKAVGTYAGESLLSSIFGTGSQISTVELCKELAVIVKEANAEQTVQEQSGYINGVQCHITVFYKNENEAGFDAGTLLTSLETQRRTLNSSLQVLRENLFAEKGIYVFITGANVMLPLLLEMAQLRGKKDNKEPKNTADFASYRDLIKIYGEYVTEMRKQILDKRLEKVTGVSKLQKCSYVPPGDTICSYYWRYTDKFDGKNYDFDEMKDYDAEGEARKSRAAHIDKLTKEVDWMSEVVTEWNKSIGK